MLNQIPKNKKNKKKIKKIQDTKYASYISKCKSNLHIKIKIKTTEVFRPKWSKEQGQKKKSPWIRRQISNKPSGGINLPLKQTTQRRRPSNN
jgi:hypothetical protein